MSRLCILGLAMGLGFSIVKIILWPFLASTSLNSFVAETHAVNRVFANNLIENDTDPRPSGLRLVLMGDSLSRYQYLSLAYFLKFGTWFIPKDRSCQNCTDLVMQKSFGSWSNFFTVTSNMYLAPYERCDCFRLESFNEAIIWYATENRYFYDAERDNMLVFLLSFGHYVTTRGRWNVSEVLQLMRNDFAPLVLTKPKAMAWEFSDWARVIAEYVKPLGATHVQFNAGYWQNEFGIDGVGQNFTLALEASNITGIWRTTSFRNTRLMGGNYRDSERISKVMCNMSNHCIDIAWTQKLHLSLFLDDGDHFQEPVYRVMNEELLERVGHHFHANYVKQEKVELFQEYYTNPPTK